MSLTMKTRSEGAARFSCRRKRAVHVHGATAIEADMMMMMNAMMQVNYPEAGGTAAPRLSFSRSLSRSLTNPPATARPPVSQPGVIGTNNE